METEAVREIQMIQRMLLPASLVRTIQKRAMMFLLHRGH
jgi:hypothetical protein